MRTKLACGVAFAALVIPGVAFAQSTASTEFEGSADVVVTGTRGPGDVGGVIVPDQPKAKVTIDQELIRRQRPGQSVNEIINLVPGVINQSNDPYGSGGGNFRIRGFDSSRISQTQDGIPLNDTGNYAIYTNQQQDPETLESVTVTLGATDVDSPTASAVGGTVNIRTRIPGDKLGALASASAGDFEYNRAFVMLDTGDFTGFGTKAFGSASWTTYDNPFNNYGKIRKQQFNGRIYQTIGSNGDFLSVAGNYNENRNNFFGSAPLRDEEGRTPGTGSGNRFPRNFKEAQYTVNFPCLVAAARPGADDTTNSCGTEFDRRFNPSNTGNIRGNSRFTVADGLVLTIDPSFQYVKANGGGTITGIEGARALGTGAAATNAYGYIGNSYYFGRDLNGDGDIRDRVTLLSPSQTQTRRYVVIANVIYDLNDHNRFRLSYTFDRGRHRQTGEVGFVDLAGSPFDVFPVNNPITDINGNVVQKRDRRSFATLHQVAGEYRGEFLNENLVVNLGLRAPFFTRDLDQNCYTTSAGGFVDCVPTQYQAAYQAANPGSRLPQERVYKYDKLLPNVGFTYHFTPAASFFASYAKGLSVPSTDTLYSAIYFPAGTAGANPAPETTDSFDVGLRYTTRKIQAQIGGFYTDFQNRIATAFDADLGENVSRNIGAVRHYGVDGSIAYQPIREITAYVFGSYLNSEIKNDLLGGLCSTTLINQQAYGCTTANQQYFFPTGGKRESGVAEYSFGGRLQGTLGPIEVGAQYKRVGSRYINDLNLPLVARNFTAAVPATGTAAARPASLVVTQLYPAKVDAYNIVDLDARFSFATFGLPKTYVQLNVTNVFNNFFIGYIGGQTADTAAPFTQIGVPRTFSASLIVGF